MGKGDVRAVLLPGAWRTLRQTPPDAERMLRHGVKIAVGTDANPGTSPTLDLVLCAALAVRDAGLPVGLALHAITAHAADALGAPDRGRLVLGGPADLALWEADSPDVFAYALGGLRPALLAVGGRIVADRDLGPALW
jgi:imidazolonepropionase